MMPETKKNNEIFLMAFEQPESSETNFLSPEKKERKKDFGFFSDVLKLVTGNGFAQLFKTLVSPIISRLYLPEFFGITQNFSSIANILAIISSLRYDQTILLPKKDEDAANQFAVSLLFTAITTPFTLLLVWLFSDDAARLLKSPNLSRYLWFVPLYVFALGSFNTFKQWNARKRQFLRLSAAQVASEVVTDGMTAGLGFADLASSNSMIISRVSGQLIASLTLAFLIFKEDGKFIIQNIRLGIMREGIRLYKKFPLYNIWAAFLSNAALYIPGFLLSGYFSPTIAGYYSLGNNVLRLPVALIANSIGQVFFQRSAKAFHEGRLAQTVLETYKQLVVLGLFPMFLITIIGRELFTLVFGALWAEAGVYSQILSVWTFFIFLVSPLSNLPNILGKNEVAVIINLIKVITTIGAFVIGGLLENARLGLWLFSISGSIAYIIYILWANHSSGIIYRDTISIFLKKFLFCSPFLIAVWVFRIYNPVAEINITRFNLSLPHIVLMLFSALTGSLYYLAAIIKDKTIREAIVDVLGRFRKKRA